MAQRLGCHVAAGYPEGQESDEVGKCTLEDGTVLNAGGANSGVVYGPDGTRVGGRRVGGEIAENEQQLCDNLCAAA